VISQFLNNGWVEDTGTGLLFCGLLAYPVHLAVKAWARHKTVMAERHAEQLAHHDEHAKRLTAIEEKLQ
jgi:hypothetical protein